MPSYPPDTNEENHSGVIELKLRQFTQLFNSMDPSPFNERDLDHDAEEFIVSWAQEYSSNAALSLRIHLSEWPPEDPTPVILEGVHNYFAYRSNLNRLEFRRLMKQGRTSLLIGLPILLICLLAGRVLFSGTADWGFAMRESLTVAGWVAIWRPVQIYLYDWWPIRRRGRTYDKLSRMPVEVIRASSPA